MFNIFDLLGPSAPGARQEGGVGDERRFLDTKQAKAKHKARAKRKVRRATRQAQRKAAR